MTDRPAAFPRCLPVGDRHLTLEVGAGISPETNALALRAERVLRTTAPPGLRETLPAYSSLLVRYDPTVTDYGALARICLEAARVVVRGDGAPVRGEAEVRDGATVRGGGNAGGGTTVGSDGEIVTIPVVYGGEWGPDLGDVARHSGLDEEEVARRHAAGDYRVYMVGFAPGFAYLGGMDPSLGTPRRATPRPRVPEGSVGIAGEQTGVYPGPLPGGWQIIGRTPLRLWRPEAAEPALLRPGKRVRFVDAGRGAEGWENARRLAASGAGRRGNGAEKAAATPAAGAPAMARAPVTAVARVRAAGPFDTVQDGGRWGLTAFGLPESGPLDWPALAGANLASGNEPGAAAVENVYGGLEMEFLAETVVAVSFGATAFLDANRLEAEQGVRVRPGQVLRLAAGDRPRSYVAIGGGGVACPVALGSRSTYTPAGLGGVEGRKLRAGDILCGFPAAGASSASAPSGVARGAAVADGAAGTETAGSGARKAASTAERPRGTAPGDRTIQVRAVPGPQDGMFEPSVVDAFFTRSWRVLASSDRRACLLDGEPLEAPAGDSVSDGTPAGSVQVPPNGKPLVLLADHQTTGGYPKIATVITPDLPVLGQAWPGDLVRFRALTAKEANEAWRRMPEAAGRDWPGNKVGASGVELERRILVLGLGGRSHLVAVDPSPPR